MTDTLTERPPYPINRDKCLEHHAGFASDYRWRKDKSMSYGGRWVCQLCERMRNRKRVKNHEFFGRTRQRSVCKKGHAIEGKNRMWKTDRNSSKGGYWVCAECHVTSRRKVELNKRAPKRIKRTRKNAFLFKMGTRQLAEYAARQVWQYNVSITEAIELYGYKIACGKLRRESYTNREPTKREIALVGEDIIAEVERLAKDESKKPWKYLQIKPEARPAWDRFNMLLEVARNTGEGIPNCQDNPAPYADYDDDNLPSPEGAYMLCADCPLIAACGTFAELERPAWGVWASDVFVNGEVVTD